MLKVESDAYHMTSNTVNNDSKRTVLKLDMKTY
jgi:hypothetical protein